MCRIYADLEDKFGDIAVSLCQIFDSLARIVVTLDEVTTIHQSVDIITSPTPESIRRRVSWRFSGLKSRVY